MSPWLVMAAIVPGVTATVIALVAAMPWGLPDFAAFALPLVTLSVISFWSARQPRLMPPALVFALGVVTDLVTAGPIGYWALLFLLAHFLATLGPEVDSERGRWLLAWAYFAVTLPVVVVAGWLIASLYYLQTVAWQPLLLGTALALAASILVNIVLQPVERQVGRIMIRGRAEEAF